VIGAGFGGLAAAVRLGARGYRVTVVEKLDDTWRTRVAVPPGRLHLRCRTDHHHRALRLRGTVGAVRPQALRRCRSLVSLDPFYTVRFDDGREFRASMPDDAAMEAEIARFSPGDVVGYRRYLARERALFPGLAFSA
jgi:phytoene desaturase